MGQFRPGLWHLQQHMLYSMLRLVKPKGATYGALHRYLFLRYWAVTSHVKRTRFLGHNLDTCSREAC